MISLSWKSRVRTLRATTLDFGGLGLKAVSDLTDVSRGWSAGGGELARGDRRLGARIFFNFLR
jgi:hypothetical protein